MEKRRKFSKNKHFFSNKKDFTNKESSSFKAKWITKSPYRSAQQHQSNQTSTSEVSKSKNSKKCTLTFDEGDRQEFLTGFQKRKAERKLRAKQEMDFRLKEEVKRIKERRDEKLKKLFNETTLAKDLNQHAEYSVQYDLPDQFVNIVGLDIGNISNSMGLSMGTNRPKDEKEEPINDKEEAEGGDDETMTNDPKQLRINLRQIRKTSSKELNSNKLMKARQRMKTKKSLQKKRFCTK